MRGWSWRCLFLSRDVCIVQFQCRLQDRALIFGDHVGFLGAMIRALGGLLGGLGRFLPCRIGANHCRLRSIGWERCGHGLTSRPLETSDAGFLDYLLSLFGYPVGSGQSLVDGSLRMRYCSANFSHKKPTWGLPHSGGVAALVDTATFRPTVVGLRGSGNFLSTRTFGKIERKRIRLTKKTNVRKRFGVYLWEQPIPKRWKADVFSGSGFSWAECRGCAFWGRFVSFG